MVPTLQPERALRAAGFRLIAGLDEVGRGSWAGPVVAAAVILPPESPELRAALRDLRDSKELSASQRETLSGIILRYSYAVGLGSVSHHVVDRLGVAAANRRAMLRAVIRLPVRPDILLLDYVRLPEIDLAQVAITRGDARSASIAAASIIAKVARDRWMARCDARFPGYGFGGHKGYGTRAHAAALRELGPCPLHRRSFAPVAALLS